MTRGRWTVLTEQTIQDLRYAVRTLRANPAFTAVAVLTLAIGVGANTAIYSVVDAAIFRPLPFRDADRLMTAALRMPMPNGAPPIDMSWSYPKYETFARAQQVFEDHALHLPEALTVTGREGAERITAEVVGARYFPILGVNAMRGRVFRDDEDVRGGGATVAIISQGYWQRQFGGTEVIGTPLALNGRPFTIVGVAPTGFKGLSGASDVWVLATAIRSANVLTNAGVHQFQMIARRRAGVAPEVAKGAVAQIGTVVNAAYPDSDGAWGAAAYTLADVRIDPTLRRAVVVLAVAVALVLLIACANIANLLLARGAARRIEIAVRLALGAERTRLVRQLLVESMLLAAAGAVMAVALAYWGVHLLAGRVQGMASSMSTIFGGETSGLTHVALSTIQLDGRALAYTALVALVTGVLFGLAPALAASRVSLSQVLRSGSSAAPVFGRLRRLTGRGMLVAGEVALAVVLLIASGLAVRSLGRLVGSRPGYDPNGLLTVRVALSQARFSRDSALALWSQLLERVSTLPGVTSAGVGSCAPVGDNCEGTGITIGADPQSVSIGMHAVTSDFFRTMRTPILRGRAFTDADRLGAVRVAVINQAAARALFGPRDPLTTPVTWDSTIRIVGVVGDIRFESIDRPATPAAFFPYAQVTRSRGMLFVRTAGDPLALAGAVRRELRAIDPNHAVFDIRPMTDRLRDATARSRTTAVMLSAFAWMALVLASIGIYGVLALAVTQRSRELGIRMALGAAPSSVLRMVVGQAFGLAGLGGAIGLGAAAVLMRGLGELLYETTALDPLAYLGTVVVLLVAALLAAFIPAARATRVNPLVALRS
jgi:putative ABC transport system permease protein